MLTQNQVKEIIEVTCFRIMQLDFSNRFINMIISGPGFVNNYPNLCHALQSSFATDAYTTIDGLFSTGNFSFGRLAQDNEVVRNYILAKKSDIEKIIPNFHEKRNEIFCHAVQKKSYGVIKDVCDKYNFIHSILIDVHKFCTNQYNILDSEYNHYTDEDFDVITRECMSFRNVLINGRFSEANKNRM